MLISVVIPCLNEAPHLAQMLDSLRDQQAPVHEVIVVDNGSTDGSRDVVREYQRQYPMWPLQLLTCSTIGAAAAMNVGIEAASGDIIVRLDAHCMPREGYVRRSVERLIQNEAGVVGGVWQVVPGRNTLTGRAIATVFSHRLASGGAAYRHPDEVAAPRPVDTVPFGCFRKSLWRTHGGYDERLQVNEDFIFNYKTRRLGLTVVLDPSIRSMYRARGTFRQLTAQYFAYGWRKAEMLKTYPKAMEWRQIVPAGFTATLLGLAVLGFFVPRAHLTLGVLLLTYVAVVLAASSHLGLSRGTVREIPAYTVVFSIVHLAWGLGACVNLLTLGQWPAWPTSRVIADGPASTSNTSVA